MTVYTFVVKGITEENEATVVKILQGISGFIRLSKTGAGEYILVFEIDLSEQDALDFVQGYLPEGVLVQSIPTLGKKPEKKHKLKK